MKLVELYRISQIGLLACALNVHGQEGSNSVEQRVNTILSQMTLDEKISYIGGTPFFDVKPIPLANLQTPFNPQIFQTDAGLGVRNSPASVRYPSGLYWRRHLTVIAPRTLELVWGETAVREAFFRFLAPGWIFSDTLWRPQLRVYDRRRSFSGKSADPESDPGDSGAGGVGMREALCRQ